ncbi:MAG: diacylglycerol kinase family protein [Chloroflexota bacterium]
MSGHYGIAIINPKAGGYSTLRDWPSIDKCLKESGIIFDHVYTEGIGRAMDLAREAANENYRYIIAVGGDGTVHEVVNGILSSSNPGDTNLGIVSAGTTCSFARSLNIPRHPVSSSKLLVNLINRSSQLIDVGIVEYTSGNKRLRRFFINEADVGLGATVVEASKKFTNYFGRSINYLPHVVGGLTSLVSYKNKRIAVHVEDRTESIYDCAMLVVANGAYFGGGMRIAPEAKPNDGLLDMVIFGDIRKSELLKVWPMTYKGRHVSHEKVRMLKVKKVDVQCDDSLLVEADGELLGEGPVSFSVVPSALHVVA